ncbi:hypothetical protein [Kribbella sindirgiensis]|uniref:Winged helix DNA-binding domain-containing protein n=1 Tax=Kribbella sindirgiensis TaxID=1124744 RepID=A0A4R0IMT2_9ACTN|nr:hypothetical protein [Kribbella sindirgiensis]TCC33710.1 hypothetical protein E0H50_17365 [Kribbella sindirgiensis]
MIKLSLQALNRVTLDRQRLLERHDATTLEAIEHLVGMQTQAPQAPYVGLWTRLTNFPPPGNSPRGPRIDDAGNHPPGLQP